MNIFTSIDYGAVRSAIREMNPVDISELFEERFEEAKEDDAALVRVFRMLSKDAAADVFAYLSSDIQHNIISKIKDYEIKAIVDDMFLDDAVDFIEEMPAGVVKRVLANVRPETRELINRFLNYPENSAGSVMTNEYIDLKEHLTVAETFAKIRREGLDKETIYTCYVIDAARRLLGTVTVKTLLLSAPGDKIGDIMERGMISASTADDKEQVANDFRKYGLLAMPVVDNESRLVGIVTVDDVMTIQEEEATEDFELMAAMSPSDEPYLKTSVWALTKNRILWLMLLMLSATLTGTIISGFEAALAALPVLVSFIPMLMDTGGNAGAQSSTLVIRGMALEEIKLGDALRVLWKELRVAMLCGGALAAVNFVRVLLMR
ncbi:MAG: magnesium transporter, partial [Oscillospiraceae bacterium]|nr:magnesium transporter [Oscillospiraceae bacterium]